MIKIKILKRSNDKKIKILKRQKLKNLHIKNKILKRTAATLDSIDPPLVVNPYILEN